MDDSLKKRLGCVIARRRNALGIPKQKFAMMIGINRLTLRYIETGQANPSLEVLSKIAHGLDCSLSELFAESEDTK